MNNVPICFNHFEFTYEIGTKDNLLKNIMNYCNKLDMYPYNYVPITFEINLEENREVDLNIFELINSVIKKTKPGEKIDFKDMLNEVTDIKDRCRMNSRIKNSFLGSLKQISGTYNKGFHLWLLKPTNFNRGNGIELFNSTAQLKNLIARIEQISSSPETVKRDNFGNPIRYYLDKTRKKPKFIVQKYCEDLMLIDNRKFDIRVLVLITHNMDVYILREGY